VYITGKLCLKSLCITVQGPEPTTDWIKRINKMRRRKKKMDATIKEGERRREK
jgi:hypothetical protein